MWKWMLRLSADPNRWISVTAPMAPDTSGRTAADRRAIVSKRRGEYQPAQAVSICVISIWCARSLRQSRLPRTQSTPQLSALRLPHRGLHSCGLIARTAARFVAWRLHSMPIKASDSVSPQKRPAVICARIVAAPFTAHSSALVFPRALRSIAMGLVSE